MPELHIQAPGKALILGEYAVLEGYPAIVQAMDKYVHIRIRPSDDHQLNALPLLHTSAPFTFNPEGLFEWQQADMHDRLPFVAPLMQALGDWSVTAEPSAGPFTITLDTQEFFTADGDKLGLGSSAALTVALAAAWFQRRHPGQHFDRDRWLPLLVELHRNLQGGRGSGADVAASLYGGLIEYRTRQNQCRAVPQRWPQPLECVWIWLGSSASTRVFLQRMSDFKSSHQEDYQAKIQTLGGLAESGCEALANQSAEDLYAAIKAYGKAMQALGEAADAPVYTDAHRRLAGLAERCGVAFKPSGAGGGDIAMAAALDTTTLANFCRQVQAAGYGLLELGLSDQGVCLHE